MNKNYQEQGRTAGPEQSLGEKLTGDVVRALEALEAKKIGDSATVAQIKGAFPHITDRDIDRTTGRSKRSGNNTATIPLGKIVPLAVGAWNRSHVGKPSYEKELKSALKDGEKQYDLKKATPTSESPKDRKIQNGAIITHEKRHSGRPRETVVWHGKTRIVVK